MYKLRQLEYFRAVMLCGSINKAASFLCVSQPVVSKTIALLEHAIDLPLFDRKGSSLVPTKNAYVLHRYCDDIFEKTNKLSVVLKQMREKNRESLKFCASPALCNHLLPRIVSIYQHEVNIKFESSMLSDISKQVEAGFYDLALSIWPIHSDRLHCTKMGDSDFVFVCNKMSRLASLSKIDFQQMLGEEFIYTNRSMPIGAYIDRQLNEAGIDFEKNMEVDRSDIACAIINFGRGVSILNRHAIHQDIWRNLVCIDLAVPIYSSVYLITPKHTSLSASAANFVRFLQTDEVQKILQP